MGSGPTIVRRARGSSSALDLDTEAGRAFLQERLAFYNKLCFLLSGGFFLVGALLMAAGVRPPPLENRLFRLAMFLGVLDRHVYSGGQPATAAFGDDLRTEIGYVLPRSL